MKFQGTVKGMLIFGAGVATTLGAVSDSFDLAGKISRLAAEEPSIQIAQVLLDRKSLVVTAETLFPQLRNSEWTARSEDTTGTKVRAPALTFRVRAKNPTDSPFTFKNLRVCSDEVKRLDCDGFMMYWIDSVKFNPDQVTNSQVNIEANAEWDVAIYFVGISSKAVLGKSIKLAWDDSAGKTHKTQIVQLPKDSNSNVTFFGPEL